MEFCRDLTNNLSESIHILIVGTLQGIRYAFTTTSDPTLRSVPRVALEVKIYDFLEHLFCFVIETTSAYSW